MEEQMNLHMNAGVGLSSYANNSFLQRTIIEKGKRVRDESLKEVYHSLKPKCFTISDMGCSSGPNTLLVISDIMETIDDARRSLNHAPPEFGVYLNDLPSNDFNTLFTFIPSFYKWVEDEKKSDFGTCFVSGTPKSFYGRVFPNNFLHFVHSCYALQWLSQVPKELVKDNGVALNKGNIYITKTSPSKVYKAYFCQFKKDFTLFLRSRAREMVPGGCMVVTFLGSKDSFDPNSIYEVVGSTLHDMVLEGIVEEEKLDKFNVPSYLASLEEVKQLVEAEGSFVLNKLENFNVDWSVDKSKSLEKRSQAVVRTMRAVMESLLASAFGDNIIDELFSRFKIKVKHHLATQTSEFFSIIASLTKKGIRKSG